MEKNGNRRDGNDTKTSDTKLDTNTNSDTTVNTNNTPKGDSSMSMTDKLMIGGAVLAAGGAAAYMLTKRRATRERISSSRPPFLRRNFFGYGYQHPSRFELRNQHLHLNG
jgi:hypothetical protein